MAQRHPHRQQFSGSAVEEITAAPTAGTSRPEHHLAAVFFDMDGTMVDSEPMWGEATYELSEKLGRRIPASVRKDTVGGSFPNTLRICAEYAGVEVDPGTAEQLREEMFGRVAELFYEHLRPKPGVQELLADLQRAGIPTAVTTNTVRPLADIEIDAVGRELFTTLVTGDQVTEYKPAPEMFVTAAERIGAPTDRCVVFEDSAAGMTGALDAGCMVIGLPGDPQTAPVAGAYDLADLAGRRSFAGVTAADVVEWFTLAEDRQWQPRVP